MRLIKPIAVTLLLVLGGLFSLNAQNRSVSGTVLDAGQQPIIGAAVMLAGGGNVGAVTDIDGNFVLEVPKDATLIVSSVGFKTQSVAVNGRAVGGDVQYPGGVSWTPERYRRGVYSLLLHQ